MRERLCRLVGPELEDVVARAVDDFTVRSLAVTSRLSHEKSDFIQHNADGGTRDWIKYLREEVQPNEQKSAREADVFLEDKPAGGVDIPWTSASDLSSDMISTSPALSSSTVSVDEDVAGFTLAEALLASSFAGGTNSSIELGIANAESSAFGDSAFGDRENQSTQPDGQGQTAAPVSPAKKQRKAKVYKDTTPSSFCHICQRSRFLVVCANVKHGSCRKCICKRCFDNHDLGIDYSAALEKNHDVLTSPEVDAEQRDGWECPHCRKACPQQARCVVYERAGQRRKQRKKASINGMVS